MGGDKAGQTVGERRFGGTAHLLPERRHRPRVAGGLLQPACTVNGMIQRHEIEPLRFAEVANPFATIECRPKAAPPLKRRRSERSLSAFHALGQGAVDRAGWVIAPRVYHLAADDHAVAQRPAERGHGRRTLCPRPTAKLRERCASLLRGLACGQAGKAPNSIATG